MVFYLANVTQQNDLNDVQTALRNVLVDAKLYGLPSQNAIVMRGTPDQLLLRRLAPTMTATFRTLSGRSLMTTSFLNRMTPADAYGVDAPGTAYGPGGIRGKHLVVSHYDFPFDIDHAWVGFIVFNSSIVQTSTFCKPIKPDHSCRRRRFRASRVNWKLAPAREVRAL